ncbi:MAG: hypothetical protein A2Y45_03735 [Tenericutes bacterium GWC2_34_14]|nr:MAG: hypothetical protein A2Y45_03735 [Tenericutes bacterium GWC2_34_14]OHE34327.1 MAG: hypothetical protein A2012_09325 [Tenericutes bacterium GWE2_34_108]OHE35679.1 MAG: hypothetical protein A2Y46_06090 [Tenericutes bacterium GWF1_35_14]OHE38894.1 MAG: hypothetical protein A2Y44_00525 [Tenericutes bacterium GWF2_35_184]OHE43926.1 MAG: hypothetical protein A2221_10420 [Tenericutes bacterium RIFOXYA2_FULL_36_32]OHE45334.1 MAG: hypothetical protein A3K26_03860 [Tenericutes bacterium RIFOXYA1
MRKLILSMLLLSMILAGCTEVSLDYLEFELNPGVDTIEINDTFIDAGAQAKYGLKNLEVITISNNVNTTQIGVYEIIYQTTHRDLVQTLVRIVTVVDETPPVLSLKPGIDTITVDETWVDEGIQATDNSQEELEIVVQGEVLPIVGIYEITYRVLDSSGNVSTIKRYVHVIE